MFKNRSYYVQNIGYTKHIGKLYKKCPKNIQIKYKKIVRTFIECLSAEIWTCIGRPYAIWSDERFGLNA